VADLAGSVGGAAENAAVDNEADADAWAEGEKDEVLRAGTAKSHAKVKLGQSAGVAIMLHVMGRLGKANCRRTSKEDCASRDDAGLGENPLRCTEDPRSRC
jgi:hypothetical protein